MDCLPQIQAHDLCQDWLSLVEVTKLDASFCSTRKRKWFHSVLGTLIESPRWEAKQYMSSVQGSDFYSWIISRNIRLVNIIICSENVCHDELKFINKSLVMYLCLMLSTSMGLSGDDNLTGIINGCPNVQIINISVTVDGIYNFGAVFSNISKEILKSLTNISTNIRDEEKHPFMMDIIKHNCTNLVSLTLNWHVSIDDIKEIIVNNPSLMDLSFSPFLSCDYNNINGHPHMSIKSFLEYLMTKVSNKFRILCINNVKVVFEVHLPETIALFAAHYKASLVHLKLPNLFEFHELTRNEIKKRQLVVFYELLMFYPIDEITSLYLRLINSYKQSFYRNETLFVATEAAVGISKTLTYMHLCAKYSDEELDMIRSVYPNLTCIQMETDDICATEQFGNIQLKYLSSQEKFGSLVSRYGPDIPIEEWQVDIE